MGHRHAVTLEEREDAVGDVEFRALVDREHALHHVLRDRVDLRRSLVPGADHGAGVVDTLELDGSGVQRGCQGLSETPVEPEPGPVSRVAVEDAGRKLGAVVRSADHAVERHVEVGDHVSGGRSGEPRPHVLRLEVVGRVDAGVPVLVEQVLRLEREVSDRGVEVASAGHLGVDRLEVPVDLLVVEVVKRDVAEVPAGLAEQTALPGVERDALLPGILLVDDVPVLELDGDVLLDGVEDGVSGRDVHSEVAGPPVRPVAELGEDTLHPVVLVLEHLAEALPVETRTDRGEHPALRLGHHDVHGSRGIRGHQVVGEVLRTETDECRGLLLGEGFPDLGADLPVHVGEALDLVGERGERAACELDRPAERRRDVTSVRPDDRVTLQLRVVAGRGDHVARARGRLHGLLERGVVLPRIVLDVADGDLVGGSLEPVEGLRVLHGHGLEVMALAGSLDEPVTRRMES